MHGCLVHDHSFDKAGRQGRSVAARAALERLDKLTGFLGSEFLAGVEDARGLFTLGHLAELILDANGGRLLKSEARQPLKFNAAQPLNLTFLGRPYRVIEIDIAKLDKAWKRNGVDYEPTPDPVIMASLARAAERGIALPPPAIALTHEGWGFFEGRNRFLYMREAGFETMPMAVPVDDAKRLWNAAGFMALPDAVGAGAARPYADILDAIDYVSFYVAQRLATSIMIVAIAGGEAETKRITQLIDARTAHRARKLTAALDFETPNINALNELRMSLMGLIREVTDDQRQAILAALKEGVARGLNPVEIARSFRGTIGLTAAQQRHVDSYRRALENARTDLKARANALGRELRDGRFDRTVRSGKELTTEQIDKMVERYRERMVKLRAETIARTEALTAAHMGELAAWETAIESGDIQAQEVVQTWVSAHDARVRLTHRFLDTQQRRWGVPFDSISGAKLRFPGDPLAPAAERIACRCVLTRQLSAVPIAPDGTPATNYAEELAHDAAGTGTASAAIEPNLGFERVGPAAGGTKPKEIWRDPQGNDYLFKPVKAGQEHLAEAEIAGSAISREVNPQAPVVEPITLDGKFGSFQKLIKNRGDVSSLELNEMTTSQLAVIQREQVVDWVIANFDAHPENFLVTGQAKKIVPIDKGDALKYSAKDVLSTTYNPRGGKEPIYNTLWQTYVSDPKFRKVMSFKPTLDAVTKLQQLPERDFVALLMPYAEAKFAGDEEKIAAFMEVAVGRKRALLTDFRAFFLSLEEQISEVGR